MNKGMKVWTAVTSLWDRGSTLIHLVIIIIAAELFTALLVSQCSPKAAPTTVRASQDAVLVMGTAIVMNERPGISDEQYRAMLDQLLEARADYYEQYPDGTVVELPKQE